MSLRSRTARGGFTLAEALLASLVLAMTITAITVPFTAAARNEQYDELRTIAGNMGQEIMEEILSAPFADPDGLSDPGPESGEDTRADFDNIDDYDGYTEADGSVVAGSGAAYDEPLAAGLSRHVSAEYVYVNGQDTLVAPTFIRVIVEVRDGGEPIVTLSRLLYAM